MDAGIVEIPVFGGKVALVDAEFAEEVRKYKWCIAGRGYVSTCLYSAGKRTVLKLHNLIWRLAGRERTDGLEIDHVDGNKLDARLEKLRLVTSSVNKANKKKPSSNTSGFKGVSLATRDGCRYWFARIGKNRKTVLTRYFPFTEEGKRDAARAVNEAYRKHYPEVGAPNPEVEGDGDGKETLVGN